ncbi:MAG: M50 family metallopeptidase [Bacillota bacterium]
MFQTVWSIVVALLILGVMVMVHELGHFLTARKLGLKVREFGIGMGPKIRKWERNGVLYSLRILPVGGFVNFYGEDEDIDDPRAFNRQKPWKRLLTIFAGPAANIVFAFIVTIGLLVAVGEAVPQIATIVPGSSAEAAGLQVGDRVVRVEGHHVNFATEAYLHITESIENGTVSLTVQRGNDLITYDNLEYKWDSEKKGKIVGVKFDPTPQRFGFFEAIGLSFSWIVFVIREMLAVIGGLFTGAQSTQALVGPVGTISLIGQSAQMGLYELLQLTVLLSVNLGIVNLIPFPALDGSRMVFTAVEKIRGKPISPEKEGMVHFVGLILLLGLMLLFTYQDIARIISGKGVGG